ncbi:MAG: T9SS type A sorting domain-containing protein [Ignavibacteriae bacterium]|nr:T9SS type A sorting domain-containing protein [Ignavibacteriota bacterium]MCB9243754.1 T9SS type A sorting domain-containing protein [Ignavibacteriales bacterium]
MKAKFTQLLILTFLMVIITCFNLGATTHTIEVGAGSGFEFVPSSTNAIVGDTILFQWVDGDHTTTCDNSTGTSLPVGAATWDEPMNSGSTTFTYIITVAGTYNYKCIPHFPSMVGTINATVSSIFQTSSSLPERYNLNQNYPNPFNPSTNIKFDIANTGPVKITIYNSLGMQVETLVNENLSPGSYQVNWNASSISSGTYFYRIETDGFVETKKMLLIK